MSLYHQDTKSLFGDTDKFNLESEDVVSFMDTLSHHAKKNGWDIFTINYGTYNKNLLTEYGELTLKNVHNYIYPVIIAEGRESQENDQLFTCLMGSLTKGACSTVTLRSEDYTFRDELSVVLLLKVILSESLVETKSTINRLQAKLTAGLPAIMSRHGNNVKSFNK